MRIFLNEQAIEIAPSTTLRQLQKRFKPLADLVVLNGFPAAEDSSLTADDQVVLIRRGEQPSAEELEALLVARHTPGVHEVMKKSCVGIAGVGGLGSAVAVALARLGIGCLVVADFDVVEPSNLNRQQYFVDQIGLDKVTALRDNLARINPYVRVIPHAVRLAPGNITDIFSEAQILVEAFDDPEQKAMLTETWLAAFPERPLVAASGLAGYAPSNHITTRRAAGNFFLVGDGETAARRGEGLMAPRVGIAAHHQANAVLRLLLGETPG